jgi:enoyl-CoA hydratase
MYDSFETIQISVDGPLATVTISREPQLNALSSEVIAELVAATAALEEAHDVRVVVLTGAGDKAFVSGADISKFESERASQEAIVRYNATVERANAAVYEYPKPTIAMIRGYCIGGGLGLAMCCDLRICSDDSRFAVPAAKLGLGYPYHGLKKLVDVVGPSFAKEIFYTARQFDAEEARAMGLVNRVVKADELHAYVQKYADAIAENAPLTIATSKFTIGEVVKDESTRDVAKCAAMVKQCFDSADYAEGRRAFMEKRKPAFTGK